MDKEPRLDCLWQKAVQFLKEATHFQVVDVFLQMNRLKDGRKFVTKYTQKEELFLIKFFIVVEQQRKNLMEII